MTTEDPVPISVLVTTADWRVVLAVARATIPRAMLEDRSATHDLCKEVGRRVMIGHGITDPTMLRAGILHGHLGDDADLIEAAVQMRRAYEGGDLTVVSEDPARPYLAN